MLLLLYFSEMKDTSLFSAIIKLMKMEFFGACVHSQRQEVLL
jgi:hypothetical protein